MDAGILIDCCPDIESFLLFFQSFLTLLTLTKDAPLFSPFPILAASAPLRESAENRLEDPDSSTVFGGLGPVYETKLGGSGVKLEEKLEENRPNGSGDKGMTGELLWR